jgi:tetraacyldisaccharide 4'-kinase
VDAGDPWGGGRLPPLGRLREPLSGLARADAVVVTKLGSDPEAILADVLRVVGEHAPGIPVLAARLEPTAVRRGDGVAGPEVLAGQRVLAVAGLGRPEGFADLLRAAGAEIVETRWFPDHHSFTETEVGAAVAAAEAAGAAVVTTAKDAVKMAEGSAVWVVEAGMVPLAGHWDDLWRLLPEAVS